jgi:hypothetical protein
MAVSEVYSLGLWGFLGDTFGGINTVEFVHCWRRNGLWPLKYNSFFLPSCRCPPRDELRQFKLWSRTFCRYAWRTLNWMKTCTLCEQAGQFHALLTEQLTGNWSFHKFIHKHFHS